MYTRLRPLQVCSLLENGRLVKRLISAIEPKSNIAHLCTRSCGVMRTGVIPPIVGGLIDLPYDSPEQPYLARNNSPVCTSPSFGTLADRLCFEVVPNSSRVSAPLACPRRFSHLPFLQAPASLSTRISNNPITFCHVVKEGYDIADRFFGRFAIGPCSRMSG